MSEYSAMHNYLDSYSPRPGDSIFDLADVLDNPIVWMVVKKDSTLVAFNGGNDFRELTEFKALAPNLFCMHEDSNPEIGNAFHEIWNQVRNVVQSGRITETKLCQTLNESHGLSSETTAFVAKSAIAAGFLDGTRSKFGLTFCLSNGMKDYVGRNSYYLSLSEEFSAIQDRLAMLVDHLPTLGNYRESLLRSFLSRHLPDKYHVASGFVLGKNHSPKRQLDILIYNQSEYSPFFRESDLVVLPVDAVRAIIEVKTTLDSSQLDKSMELLDDTIKRETVQLPFFKGIYAFHGKMRPETIARHLSDYYNGFENTPVGPMQRTLRRHFQAVDAVAIGSKVCLVTEPEAVGASRMFSCGEGDPGDPFTTAFLASLVTFLDVSSVHKHCSVAGIQQPLFNKRNLGTIHDASWKACLFGSGENQSDFAQQQYLKRIRAWRYGQAE